MGSEGNTLITAHFKFNKIQVLLQIATKPHRVSASLISAHTFLLLSQYVAVTLAFLCSNTPKFPARLWHSGILYITQGWLKYHLLREV